MRYTILASATIKLNYIDDKKNIIETIEKTYIVLNSRVKEIKAIYKEI